MISFFRGLLSRPPVQPEIAPAVKKPVGIFSTDEVFRPGDNAMKFQEIMRSIEEQQPRMTSEAGTAMDAAPPFKLAFNQSQTVPNNLMMWYGSQSFIGYQMCALMAQHWLIAKACSQPAEDAVRNGYEVTVNDGSEVDPEMLDKIRKLDVQYEINKNLIQFVEMGRVFGIRIAVFKVQSDDPDYYKNPFNIDGVKPGTYKGISQIDPYWITPQLSNESAGDPFAMDFYEPTWWRINGILVHRSHMVIFRTEELADVLKPVYIYGSVSIPQKIYERVYAAERTANEAPMLALSKRTDVVTCDMTQAIANQADFEARMQIWAYNRDNYGIKAIGLEEKMEQFDTTLSDLDAVIMSQYQLVAAIANVPATKLLGTQPKGFNTTGEFEEANYHEELESIQTHDLTPMLERHHQLLIKSEIDPDSPFEISITWNALDALTKKEQAELNKLKAETGQILAASGAIDGQDERDRIITDPESGYSGLIDEDVGVVEADPEDG